MNNLFRKLYKSKNLRNSYWMIGEKVFQMLLSLVVGILTARYLGPTNFGTLNYTAAFIAFFTNIAALSMNSVMIVKLIHYPDQEGQYLGSALLYRVIAALLSSISIACLIVILNPGDSLKLTLAMIQSIQLLFKAFDILDVWFQRRLKSKYASIGKMLASLVVSAYKIFLLVTYKGLVWFAFSNVLSDFVIAAVLLLFYKLECGQKLEIRIEIGNELLKESYHFLFADLMSALYTYLDRIMIGGLMTDADVGFYSVAVSVSGMWIFVPVAIINSYKPTVLEYKANGNEKQYRLRLKQLIASIFWLSTFVALIVTLLGRVAVGMLYGESYLPAVIPLVFLTWAEVFGVTSMTRVIWILSENKSQYVKLYVFIGTVVNCILNYILISNIGIVGAALATLITQIVVCIFAPLFFRETRALSYTVIDAISLRWLF